MPRFASIPYVTVCKPIAYKTTDRILDGFLTVFSFTTVKYGQTTMNYIPFSTEPTFDFHFSNR